MREPPADLRDDDLLDLVRREWDERVDALTHLPVGFGAHHWAGLADGVPLLFVTVDRLEPKRTLVELEAAYAGAAVLADRGLDFVLACRPAADGRLVVPFAGGATSVTPWHDGAPGDGTIRDAAEARECAELLVRLHATAAPPGIPQWEPLVGPSLPGRLRALAAEPWTDGPYGERARAALRGTLADVERWTDRYHALAGHARRQRASWVATHGEPDTGNQLVTAAGRFLVDWESLRLAPRERDLRTLVDVGFGDLAPECDPLLLEMFDLEWRLDEVAQYAAWFAAHHTGTASDEVALGGLLHELGRADWAMPRQGGGHVSDDTGSASPAQD